MMKNKKSKGQKSVPVRRQIVDELVGGIGNFLASIPPLPTYSRSNYFSRTISEKQWQRMLAEGERQRAIREMRRKKLLKDKKQGSKVVVLLSAAAVLNAARSLLCSQSDLLQGEKQCLVLFDFPVGASKARDRWRKLLLSCGMEMVQLSCYITRNNVSRELLGLVRLLGIEKWVNIYVVERLDDFEAKR